MGDLMAEVGKLGKEVSCETSAISGYLSELEQKAGVTGSQCACKLGLDDTAGCDDLAEWRRASFLGQK